MDIPAISCPSCNANVESVNHVFFECDIACGSSFLNGVIFLFFKLLLRILSMIGSSLGMLLKRHRFYVITTSVLWWLWRYRNSVTFNSQTDEENVNYSDESFVSLSFSCFTIGTIKVILE
ncbi:hypothetical protein Tco_1180346 [Tanacetum coccineum]